MGFSELATLRFKEWQQRRGFEPDPKWGAYSAPAPKPPKPVREPKVKAPKAPRIKVPRELKPRKVRVQVLRVRKADNQATNALWQTTGQRKPEAEKRKVKKEVRKRWYENRKKRGHTRSDKDRAKARAYDAKRVAALSPAQQAERLAKRRANNAAWKARKAQIAHPCK